VRGSGCCQARFREAAEAINVRSSSSSTFSSALCISALKKI